MFRKFRPPWLGDKENSVPHSFQKALKQLLFNLKTLLQYLNYKEE